MWPSQTLTLLPPVVLTNSCTQAERWTAEQSEKPRSVVAAVVIAVVWMTAASLAGYWLLGR